ncbi:MAG: hypothetical protein ACRYGR_07935 [Janthinobacterium lividum]
MMILSHFKKEILPFIRISDYQKLAIEFWWQAFEKDQNKISDSFNPTLENNFNISSWMQEHLQNIDDDIMWEFGPGLQKKHRLIITSESKRQLRPLIQYMLNESPDLEDWEFYEYRLPEDLNLAQQTMNIRTNWHNISNIEFELVEDKFNKIEIIYYICDSLNQEETNLYNCYILTESLLGEEILHKWIGHIDVQLKVKKKLFRKVKIFSQSIEILKETVLKNIQEIKSDLFKDFYFMQINNREVEWCVMKSSPIEQIDYSQKNDLYISSFILTKNDLFNALYKDYNNFSSERFSNFNEIFLYLKIDGTSKDLNQDTFIDRVTIEDMLNESLLKDKLGCVIGGSTGLKYSYIDFALTDLTKAIQVMQKILQEGKLTKRSWFLFSDDIYQSEWIGVYNDSLPPFIQNDN